MKKSIKLFVALLVFSIFALGSATSGKTKDVIKDNNSTSGNTSAVTDEKENGSNDDWSDDWSDNSDDSDDNSGFGKVTIDEQELFSQSGVTLTATEYTSDSWSEGIKILVNNESDKDITVSCYTAVVNDYMTDASFYSNVSAGKKSKETLTFYSDTLKRSGIDTIGKMELYFEVYDTDSYDTIYKSDAIVIETSAADDIKVNKLDNGVEIYNKNGIKIVGKELTSDEYGYNQYFMVFIENNSDKDVMISSDDVSVNGYMVSGMLYADVLSGKMSVEAMSFYNDELADNDIEKIEEIEMKLSIWDDNNYDTIDETESIVITFK